MDSGQAGPAGSAGGAWPDGEAAELTDVGPAGSAGGVWPDGEAAELTDACPAEFPELADEPCGAPEAAAGSPCRAREVLQRVGDKWSVQVIDLLREDTMRFTELHRSIDGVTARMLTVTLRGLERDGIVTRTIHPVIPPRVDYALTPMGRTLLDTISQLVAWADSHVPEIEAARASYDAKHQPS